MVAKMTSIEPISPKPARRPRRGWRAFLFRDTRGLAAAEAALLALLFIGMGIFVGRILKPTIQTAARNLNQELTGGVK